MNRFLYLGAVAVLGALLSACSSPHGQPQSDSESVAPSELLDFAALYSQNCAGCHGAQGRGGAAIALADPVYLEIINQANMRRVIAGGVHGTSMPAFAQSAGGMLTDKQVDAIAGGIFSQWGQRGVLAGSDLRSYAPRNPGNAANGELAFGTYCASCHGSQGQGGPKGSAIVNDSFLALVSDQGLRTVVIAGRPELGAPAWRGNVPGRPMTEQESTDVVAWLATRRAQTPGQPYSATNYPQQH